ncbi:MAG: transcription elongation factor GreA [Anaerolineae bacterium]|nr:transcription elongation factor GreA [Anaerolineae bacterium]
MPRKVHYLTPEGRQKIEQELEYLRTVRRPEMARSLKDAIEEGDLAENAGYSESKREQAMLEGRIAELEEILANAEELEYAGSADVVALGTQVTVIETGFEPETYQIVGAAEADPARGRISNESPLGMALLGRRIGDRIQVKTPGGVAAFEITAIS